MNKPWKRKPHPEWKEHRIEDLFYVILVKIGK
jgi:hypothetical protein